MDTFVFDPLSRRQIRLLKVETGQDGISCEMTAHSLDDDDLRYAAISYTWGDAAPARAISLNGRQFSVTANCWYTLWQVINNPMPVATVTKGQERVDLFWIDSICINQADSREKSVQITQMGETYARAHIVAACVGPEAADAQLFDEEFAWYWGSLTREQQGREYEVIAAPIAHLLQRSYFHRLWTVQECLLAKDIHVYCGSKCVRWRMLRVQFRSAEMARGGYSVRQESQVLSNFFNDMDMFQTRAASSVQLSLADLINRYGFRACADPRDKLYGLLSLAPAWIRRRIVPDYSKSLSQVLWEYSVASASYMIENGVAHDMPDVPTSERKGYSYQRDCDHALRSVAALGKTFLASADFALWLERFWRWRLSGEGEVDSAMVLGVAAMHYFTGAQSHRVDLSGGDDLLELEEGWLGGVRERLSRSRESFTVAVGTASIDINPSGGCADMIASSLPSQPKLLEASVSSNWGDSGTIRFLVPASIRTGDCLVSFGTPYRTSAYVICRVQMGCMPTHMSVVGFAKLVPHPDVEPPKVWPRIKSDGKVYLRPHDLIAVALMRSAGMEFLDLPILEPGHASFAIVDGKFKRSEDAAEEP